MAIRIINGRAVVVPEGQSTPVPQQTSQPTIPTPSQPTSSLFTNKDPRMVLDTLKSLITGFVPGAETVQKVYSPQTKPQERLTALSEVANPATQLGKYGVNWLKTGLGLPFRVLATFSDILGGPKKFDVPLLGPQQSPIETARQFKAEGAGPVVSTAIPILQTLMDTLLGKSMVKHGPTMGLLEKTKPEVPTTTVQRPTQEPVQPKVQATIPKPAGYYGAAAYRKNVQGVQPNEMALDLLKSVQKENIPTNEQLAQGYLKRTVNIPKPKETAIPTPKDNLQPLLDQLVRYPKERNIIQQKIDAVKRLNPYQFETGKLEGRGPEGKKIVMLGRRVNADAITTAGELRNQIQDTGLPKLTEPEQFNFRQVLENKAAPLNDNVANVTKIWRDTFNKYGAETQVQMLENYYPRRLNEAGMKFYEDARNKGLLVEEVMKQQGLDKVNAIKYVDKSLRKGSFEFERILPDIPEQFRLKPLEELYQWAAEVSRRTGVIRNFGKKNEIINNLMADLGKGDKNQFKIQTKAQEYVNRVMGKDSTFSDLDPVYNILKQGMVIGKLNPLTTIGNEIQAHVGSYLDYGLKGLADATFGKGGETLIRELGLKDIRGKYGENINPDSLATKWMRGIGMEGSEIRGFARTAVSSKAAIERAFNKLRKNPGDVAAKKLLNDHAMYVDDATLAADLANGKISPYEMKIGIVEGVRRKMFFATPGERPTWANAGAGNVAYTFKNYLLNQLQLLAKAPPERQLAYMMVIAPMTGLPILVLRRAIQGKPMPKDLADWYVSSAAAGPGTFFDILQSLSINPSSFAVGGFSPLVDIGKQAFINKSPRGTLKSAVSNLPLSSLYLNRLFPPKK